jgi:hypothetical protein
LALFFISFLLFPLSSNIVFAASSFEPTGGSLVTGTETTITSATASGNVGSWRGTLAQDATAPGLNWTVNTNATTGLDQQLQIDNVTLNGANKMMIVVRANASAITIIRFYQICDWVSSANVDNAADANCTGGGWRTLNIRKGSIASVSITNYNWHIYDGYWTTSTTGNTPVSTPLTNFVRNDSTKRVLIRAYSTSAVAASTHTIDWVRVSPVIDSMYSAAGLTQITGGTISTSYINTINATLTGQTASDGTYLSVPGTASAISDFYLSYKNVKTYTGMNTILVVANYGCTATGISIKPKIYNFTTSSWENLTTSTIACSTTQAVGQFAKNNVTMTDYISNGEIRVGWFGSANNTLSIRLDYQYIMLGTTNTDTALCEISFGTGTAANCANTRDLDSTLAAPVTWQQTTELESAAFGHTYYPNDNDGDAVTGEAAASANLSFNVTPPNNASVVNLGYAMRWRSNSTTITTTGGFKDNQGDNPTIRGGWTDFGTTNLATTYTYEDHIFNNLPFANDPKDYIDQINDRVNVRIRTSTATATANVTRDIDFVMVTFSWREDPVGIITLQSSYESTGGSLVTGTEATITSAATSGNVGSWRGTLAQDATAPGWNWTVNTNAATGLDQELQIDNVSLNGANKMMVVVRAASSVATINRQYQICDWVSTANVDNAADANCTGGGWRTMNLAKTNITTTTITNYTWHIYDGYWTTSTTGNTPVSTPLTNFVRNDSTKRVLIRAYSPSAVAGTHTIDWARISPVIDSMYSAAGFTQITGGTVATSYINTINATLTGQTAVNAVYLNVPGTAGAIADFYLSYKNVKTYTGMNTIVVVSNYGCSATGINIKPKIYNFTSGTWEDLTTTTIACSTTQATAQFAKNNITISDYVNNGEVRIGWYGSANNVLNIRIDMQYILLGTTNTNNALCEISFGTGTATNCSNTRDLDSTLAAPVTWQQTTELESGAFGHTYYPNDNDGDAITGESAAASNLSFNVTPPSNASVVSLGYAMRWRSNSTIITTTGGFKDHQGDNPTIRGGWTDFGTTNLATTYTYEDYIFNNLPFINDAKDYLDRVNNTVAMRVRTSSSNATANVTQDIDFAFVTLTWLEGPSPTVEQEAYRFFNNLDSTDVGTPIAALNTPGTLSSSGDALRLRLLLSVSTAQLPINSTFKLQYVGKGSGTCAAPSGGTPSTYTDISTSTLISYKDNATPSDGAALTANANDPTGSYTIQNQTYEELNNFMNTLSAIPTANSGKWDFSLYDHGSPASTTFCFRVVAADGTPLTTYTRYPEITTGVANTPPNFPTILNQTKTDSTTIGSGGWTNQTDVKFIGMASDPNNPDTLSLCVEKKPLGSAFTNTEDSCGTPVSYTGSSVIVNATITGITDATQYHWQARVKDTAGAYSSWVSYGGPDEAASDFGIDTTAPTALTIYDGTTIATDSFFNDGSLSSLSANWDSLNANVSGLLKYEYSIGTTPGATDIKTWTNNATSTSVTATGLTLQSSQMYYFNVRVTDNATNTAIFSSNGQRILPSLSFSLSNSAVSFGNLNNGNSFTNSQSTTLTTTTNAYNGYVIKLFKADSMRSVLYPSVTIGDFDGGNYANPGTWGASNYGLGYNSSDTLIQGADKFNAATCPGGGAPPCFAPFSSSAPGDIVADHTANVSGAPISNEQFTITYKIKTLPTQTAGLYSTTLVYTIIPQY